MKEKNSFWVNIKKTWRYIKECKWDLLCYALVSIIEAIIGAILPLIEAKIILYMTDNVLYQLFLSALAVFIIEIVLYSMFFFKNLFYQKIYQNTLVNLQVAIAKETLKLEVKEIDQSTSGLFIDRLNRDTSEISSLFMEYSYWISYVISNIGVLVAVFFLNKYLCFYAIVISVCIFLISKKRLSKETEVKKEMRKIHEKKTGLTSELVRGIRDIKVLNAYDSILSQTSKKIKETSNEEMKMLSIRRKYNYAENLLRAVSDFIFLMLGCFLLKKNLLTIPTFVIVYNYQPKIKNLLSGLVQLFEYNKNFSVAAERVYEVIEDTTFAKEQFGHIHLDKLNGDIKFQNVTFQYNDNQQILKGMSFEVKPNEKVAFVGKSGAGKTTIFSLITKLYHVDDDSILLDGYSLNDLDCDTIRNNMSIITQNPYIFNFSIKENLLLAKPDATMEEMRDACKLARIDEYIMSLPDGYDSLVGENGVVLSGGQKQRLAIARALLMKTEIILFDEATSALDNETQSEIQKAIDNLKGEYTILIVAHRLSTIIDCDKIFVVNDGKIISSGSHKELLKKCEFYKDLYEKDLQV